MDECVLAVAGLEFAKAQKRPGRAHLGIQLHKVPESWDGRRIPVGIVVERPQRPPTLRPSRPELEGFLVKLNRFRNAIGLACCRSLFDKALEFDCGRTRSRWRLLRAPDRARDTKREHEHQGPCPAALPAGSSTCG